MTKIERLKKIIREAQQLIDNKVDSDDIGFKTWKNKAKSFLLTIFKESDFQYKEFNSISYWELDYSALNGFAPSVDQSEICKNGLLTAIGQLKNILETMEDDEPAEETQKDPKVLSNKKIFIVHGHDDVLKESVARIIEKQGIEAIILSEKANQGRTIIEKFEDYSDVGGAICLFTADDIGCEKFKSEGNPRARQNVVFEAGYFMGKLGRNHVVLLADSGVEMPSDLSGVVYTNTANWQFELLKELNAMGYKVDMNKLL